MIQYMVREQLKPSGLLGISNEQIEDHWRLYRGYVTQCNRLHEELADMRSQELGDSQTYADRRRRMGFEYSGMVLHEYYFGNLMAGVALNPNCFFVKSISGQFGSFEAWRTDFINAGRTRGIGWAMTYMDPRTGQINNHFIHSHEEGSIPGFIPILVMDVFEHAYMVDHGADGRGAYINAFFENINWEVVAERFDEVAFGRLPTSRGVLQHRDKNTIEMLNIKEEKAERVCQSRIQAWMASLTDWIIEKNGRKIVRAFDLKNPSSSSLFADWVEAWGDRENHHPTVAVHDHHCIVGYTTHEVQGLTEKDFVAATQIDTLFKRFTEEREILQEGDVLAKDNLPPPCARYM